MSKIISLNLSSDEYKELAHEVYDSGDKEQAIIYLKDALKLDKTNSGAYHFLAQIYSELGLFVLSNSVLYHGLHNHIDEDPKEFYSQLGYNFMALKYTEAVIFYLKKMDLPFLEDNLDVEIQEEDEENEIPYLNGFKLVHPKNDEIYNEIIDEAFESVQNHEFDKALKLLSEVPDTAKQWPQVVHLRMICYLMKNDSDRVISIGLKFLRKQDYLPVKCMLCSAYALQERYDEAYDLVNNILLKDYTKVEDILIILPVLINLKVHAQVVKYIKRVMPEIGYQMDMRLWLGQALYNMGNKKEAIKLYNKLEKIYGDLGPCSYYLELFNSGVETVEYGTNIPLQGRVSKYAAFTNLLNMNQDEFEIKLYEPDTLELVNWIFNDGNAKLIEPFLNRTRSIKNPQLDNYYREFLIRPLVQYGEFALIMQNILGTALVTDVDIVTEGKYKEVHIRLPKNYRKLPGMLKHAIRNSIFQAMYNEDDPDKYINVLKTLIEETFPIGEDGKVVYTRPELKTISSFKSLETFIVALSCKVNKILGQMIEIGPLCKRFHINKLLFDKYYMTLFGEVYDS